MIKLASLIKEASKFETYHDTYTSAINAAKEYAEKQGYEVDEDSAFRQVAMNTKRPSEGKTVRTSVELTKGGKPTKKQLHIQVYGMKSKYELNCYIN